MCRNKKKKKKHYNHFHLFAGWRISFRSAYDVCNQFYLINDNFKLSTPGEDLWLEINVADFNE